MLRLKLTSNQMEDKTKSEDLYAELEKVLKNESAEEKTVAADDQKSTTEKTVENTNDEQGDISEEEISKLHPKAQKRIKELADKVKELAEKPAEKPVETPKPEPQDFQNVREFLDAVEDEPSRKLLEKFYGVIRKETSTILAPIEKQNAEAKFSDEFKKYEAVEGLADYKSDLLKTFLRDPNQSIKALISETAMDIQLNKVKPIEKTPSTPNRGQVDTSNLSKDELYTMLESMKE